jgi:hypothetical protein
LCRKERERLYKRERSLDVVVDLARAIGDTQERRTGVERDCETGENEDGRGGL